MYGIETLDDCRTKCEAEEANKCKNFAYGKKDDPFAKKTCIFYEYSTFKGSTDSNWDLYSLETQCQWVKPIMMKWMAGTCSDEKFLLKSLTLKTLESCDQACVEEDTQTCVDISFKPFREGVEERFHYEFGTCKLYMAGCDWKYDRGFNFYSSSLRVYPSKEKDSCTHV